MHPILIKIYGIPIYSYGFFLAMAFFVCLIMIMRRAMSIGIAPHHILDIGLYIIIFGVIGARFVYVSTNLDYYLMHPLEIVLLNKGGLVFYGGLIAALIVGLFVAKKRRLPVLKITDLFVTYLPLGQAIGRIGCFLNGCCYGKTTNCILGVRFPEYSFPATEFGPDHCVYPVQLISSVVDLMIFFVLISRMKYKKFDGQVVLYYMFLYGSARFVMEFIRADNPEIFYGFNFPQLVSVVLITVSIAISILEVLHRRLMRKDKEA